MTLQQAIYMGDILVSIVQAHRHAESSGTFLSPLSWFLPPHRCTHTDNTAHAPISPFPHALAVAVASSPSLFLSSRGMKGESTLWETLLCGTCTAGTTSPYGMTGKWREGVVTQSIHVPADWECLWSVDAAFLPRPFFTSHSCGEKLPYDS